jgi:hypothetical protein
MDTTLPSAAIAEYWPVVEAHLNLDRRPAMRRVLRLLAQAVTDHAGAPAKLGHPEFRAAGMKAGEARAAGKILRELQRRGVLYALEGSARRQGIAWGFRGDLSRWRMPWRWSSRSAVLNVGARVNRALFANIAHLPGERLTPLRLTQAGRPSAMSPPGDLPVDWRNNQPGGRDDPIGETSSEGSPPVNWRDNAEHEISPLSDSRLRKTSSSLEDDDEGLHLLAETIRRATGSDIWGGAIEKLWAIRQDAGDRVARLGRALEEVRGVRSPPQMVIIAERLLAKIIEEPPSSRPGDRAAQADVDRILGYIATAELAGYDAHQWDEDLAAARARLARGA